MKIGLVLSGGGVLGAAHVGLLEEIEKRKIPADIITGVSIGAIVGALYAEGGTKLVMEFFERIDRSKVTSGNFVTNLRPDLVFDEIRHILTELLPECIHDLPIKFACVATNLQTGKRVVFEKGNLVDCLMASAAYPGFFPVQQIDGDFLIDGGISRNLPVGTARRLGADFVIGSSLYNIGKFKKLDEDGKLKANRLDIILRSLDIVQKNLAELEERRCDFCLFPKIEGISWTDFSHAGKALEAGRKSAAENIQILMNQIKKQKAAPSLFKILFDWK